MSRKFSPILKASEKIELTNKYRCLSRAVSRNGNGLETKNGKKATPSSCIAGRATWYFSPSNSVIILLEKIKKIVATGKPATTKNFTLRVQAVCNCCLASGFTARREYIG